MMLGVQAIDLNSESITRKVFDSLEKYDSEIKDTAKTFEPRGDVKLFSLYI